MDTFYIMEHKHENLSDSFLVIEKRESPYHTHGEIVSSGNDIHELVENCEVNVPTVINLPDVEQGQELFKNPVGADIISHFNDVYRKKFVPEFDHSGIPYH